MMCIPIAGGLRAAVPLEVGWGLAAPLPDVGDTSRSNSRPDVVGKARLRGCADPVGHSTQEPVDE